MTAIMQAFVKHGSTPGDAGLTTVNVPEPGEGEALVRVAACGICGSDLIVGDRVPLGGSMRGAVGRPWRRLRR